MKGNLRGKREKSGNLNSQSKRKSCTIPFVQSDDLSFYQNATSKSQGNSFQVREKSGKIKVKNVATLYDCVSQFSFVVLSEINYNLQ